MSPLRHLLYTLVFALGCNGVVAQSLGEPVVADSLLQDTVAVLSFAEYMQMVRDHHPVMRRSQLITRQADFGVREARGAFDPYAFANIDEKLFKGTEYYNYRTAGLKLPTWYGIELKAQYEDNKGVYLNPESLTPLESGLFSAGLSVTLGQGLFIDERRAGLRRAQILQDLSLAEQRALVNEVLLEAGEAYWNWYAAYRQVLVFEEGLQLAQVRNEAVIRGAELGDRPMVDTLEATIQVQNRQLSLTTAQLEYQNAQAYLSVYLWSEGLVPLELTEAARPELDGLSVTEPAVVNEWLLMADTLIQQHPEYLLAQGKIAQIEIDRRLKLEQLKPTLNLNYNLLTEGVSTEVRDTYTTNNYKWGVEFAFPLFLRKARGGVQVANLKLEGAQFDLVNKQAGLLAKIEASSNKVIVTQDQVEQYRQIVQNYLRLVNAEQRLFRAGESSLFLVNSREQSYISAQLKLIETIVKNQVAQLEAQFALGRLQ